MREAITTDRIDKNTPAAGWRPAKHFSAHRGWINDPCGVIYYKNQYHLFYQHNPYASLWGPMHWGHAVSADLMHWHHLPIALFPMEEYEFGGGCFTGSAVEKDGKLYLFYTGAKALEDSPRVETQCLAYSDDGVIFKKYPGNPILEPPASCGTDFRDPTVWEHEGKWYMAVASTTDNRCVIPLFESVDLFHWSYKSAIFIGDEEDGKLWECPDVQFLGGRCVLIYSGAEYTNAKVRYIVGDLDYRTGVLKPRRRGIVDYGFDYYASKSFPDPAGGLTAIGWMNGWDWMDTHESYGPTGREGWRGSMSLPRRLDLTDDGRLRVTPHESVLSARVKRYRKSGLLAEGEAELAGKIGKRLYEVRIEISAEDMLAKSFGLQFKSKDGDEKVVLEFEPETGLFRFQKNGLPGTSKPDLECILDIEETGRMSMDVFVDTYSVEVFINDGEACISNNVFSSALQNTVTFFSRGGTCIGSLELYAL